MRLTFSSGCRSGSQGLCWRRRGQRPCTEQERRNQRKEHFVVVSKKPPVQTTGFNLPRHDWTKTSRFYRTVRLRTGRKENMSISLEKGTFWWKRTWKALRQYVVVRMKLWWSDAGGNHDREARHGCSSFKRERRVFGCELWNCLPYWSGSNWWLNDFASHMYSTIHRSECSYTVQTNSRIHY